MQYAKRQKLFFALWPDDALRKKLVELLKGQRFWGTVGKEVPSINFHITLRYLGFVSSSERECAKRIAEDGVGLGCFKIRLNRVGYWASSGVAWLGTDNTPPQLQQLVDILETGMQRCGLRPETRLYQPHLTFMRKVQPGNLPQAIESLLWQVDEFVLVRSVPDIKGVRYEVVGRWYLGTKKEVSGCLDC